MQIKCKTSAKRDKQTVEHTTMASCNRTDKKSGCVGKMQTAKLGKGHPASGCIVVMDSIDT